MTKNSQTPDLTITPLIEGATMIINAVLQHSDFNHYVFIKPIDLYR